MGSRGSKHTRKQAALVSREMERLLRRRPYPQQGHETVPFQDEQNAFHAADVPDAQRTHLASHVLARLADCGVQVPLEVVRFLVGQGARVEGYETRSSGTPVLCLLLRRGCALDVLDVLLDAGADVNKGNAKNLHPSTPLECAMLDAVCGADVVVRLIEEGADVRFTRQRWTYLHSALSQRYGVDVIGALLDAGADVHGETLADGTALAYACDRAASVEVVRLLLEGGARVDVRADKGRTPLMLAARANRLCKLGAGDEVVRALLEAGAKVDVRDKLGFTALAYAAMYGHTAAVRVLLEHGAQIDVRTKKELREHGRVAAAGSTPVELARTVAQDEELARLIKG